MVTVQLYGMDDDPNRGPLRWQSIARWLATPRRLALLAATALAICVSYSLAAPFLGRYR